MHSPVGAYVRFERCMSTMLLTRLPYNTRRLPGWSRELPQELIKRLRAVKVRPPGGGFFPARHPFDPADLQAPNLDQGPKFHEDFDPGPLIPKARRDGAPLYLGPRVTAPDIRHMSNEEFSQAKVFVGSFIATRPARSSALAAANPMLIGLDFWIFLVRAHFQPGSQLPANSRHKGSLGEDCYECQLYAPDVADVRRSMFPCWQKEVAAQFLFSEEEEQNKKAAYRKEKRLHEVLGPRLNPTETIQRPIVAFLRPTNIIGGGFSLTRSHRVPQYVAAYVASVL